MNGLRATIAAAALALAATGCGGGGDKGADQAGARVFKSAGCAGCHTLSAAGAKATVGPNLDQLKPDAARVERQVRRGGNGMPAFAGKLSGAEIAAVAQYVSEASRTASATQAAAFKPTSTTLADCRRNDSFECYEQAFGNLVYRKGPKPALALLERYQTSNRTVSGDCHRVAHIMGGAALARFKGSVAKAFVGGSAVCASGYYHGILERGFAGVQPSQLAGRARSMCSDKAIEANGFLAYQCLHGLGHGLMIYTGYDLPLSLKTCDRLASSFARISCPGGVFMENFNTSYGTRSPWLRSKDLLYPCDVVRQSHKYYCYLLVTSRILPAVKYDWRKTAAWCRRSERRWEATCFQSYGRDVSGTAGKSIPRAVRLCRYAGRQEGNCVYGVARDIVNTDANGERASRFCRREAARWRGPCFNGIGSVLASLSSTTDARRAACRKVSPRRYYLDCAKGAGIV